MDIDNLKGVLSPPATAFNTGAEERWGTVEEELGSALPTDYKEFIAFYGTGGIDDFLWILNPFVENENIGFFKKVKVLTEAYLGSQKKFPKYFTHDVFPTPNGLLPWGFTANGDEIYWRTEGTPDNWTVVIYESRSPEYVEYSKSMTQFLYEVVSGKLECEVFPDDFPDKPSVFVAYDWK